MDGKVLTMAIHEPDALIRCGARLPRDTLVIPDPVAVFEVISPSSRRTNSSTKLDGYFKVATIAPLRDLFEH